MKKLKKVFFTMLNVILLLPTRVFAEVSAVAVAMYGVSPTPSKPEFPSVLEIIYKVILGLLVPYIILKGILVHIKKIEKEEKVFYKVLTVLETLVCCALGLFMIGTICVGAYVIILSLDSNGDLLSNGSSFIDAMIKCITLAGPLLIIWAIVIGIVNMLWKRSFSMLMKITGLIILTDIIYVITTSILYVTNVDMVSILLIFLAIFIVAILIRIFRMFFDGLDEKQTKQNNKRMILNFVIILLISAEILMAENYGINEMGEVISFSACMCISLGILMLGEDIHSFIVSKKKIKKVNE